MTINELIATSSVHAFNSGVQSGRALEQERIIKLLQKLVYRWDGFLEIDSKITTMTELADWLTGKDND
jgi:hypothetical protein